MEKIESNRRKQMWNKLVEGMKEIVAYAKEDSPDMTFLEFAADSRGTAAIYFEEVGLNDDEMGMVGDDCMVSGELEQIFEAALAYIGAVIW